MFDRFRGGRRPLGFETAPHQGLDRITIERLQTKQRAATAQRRVDFEERVLGGRTDHRQGAVLDGRQQSILLSLVEPMDLVEEQDRAPAVLADSLAGPLDHVAHVLDPGIDSAHLFEDPFGATGDGQSQRGFPGPGRAPEDRAGQPVLFDQATEWLAWPDEVVLADDIVERPRSQTGS
jgi:hypothetical protein